MSDPALPTPKKPLPAWKEFWKEYWHHPATIVVGLMLALVLYEFFRHVIFQHLEGDWRSFFAAMGTSAFVGAFAVAISLAGFKWSFSKKATDEAAAEQKKWEQALADLGKVLTKAHEYSTQVKEELDNARADTKSKIQQELKSLADQKALLETECDKKRQSLVSQEQALKGIHKWLIAEEDIVKLEARTDAAITVIVRDFAYEEMPDYEVVIAENLHKPAAPTYEYFVLESNPNKEALRLLRRRLEDGLAKQGCKDPQDRLKSRFLVRFIPTDAFPHSVVYGLVIYSFRDSRNDRCFSYWPEQIAKWNLDIISAGNKSGETIIKDITYQLRNIYGKYPIAT